MVTYQGSHRRCHVQGKRCRRTNLGCLRHCRVEFAALVDDPDRARIAAPGIPLVIFRLGVFNLTGAWLAPGLDEVER